MALPSPSSAVEPLLREEASSEVGVRWGGLHSGHVNIHLYPLSASPSEQDEETLGSWFQA